MSSQRISLKNPVHLLAFGFGSGLAPKAPGTFGTLAAIPFYLLLAQLPLAAYAGIVIIASLVGIKLCDQTANDMGVHDDPSIVWDEFCGYWITMFMAPQGWQWVLIGFVLFRIFDIIKPWPIRLLDRNVHGGFGIMMDDLLAGVFGFIALQLIHSLWPLG